MFKITQSAARQIEASAQKGAAEGLALRFAAIRRENGSFDYKMGFDDVKEDDINLDQKDIKIVMAPEYVPLLDETILDYVKLDNGETQFIFINPKDTEYVPPSDS